MKAKYQASRDTTLSAFLNLIINALIPEMQNPCQSPAAKNLFNKPKICQWAIFDKDTIDEAIFRTINIRNRIMLELMARGEMRSNLNLGKSAFNQTFDFAILIIFQRL